MKSLALHLSRWRCIPTSTKQPQRNRINKAAVGLLLLLVSLLATVFAATASATTTTTQRPPSLRAPPSHQTLTMTTTIPTVQEQSRRGRASSLVAHAKRTTSSGGTATATSAPLRSTDTRVTRSTSERSEGAGGRTAGSGMRQNRSLQSASTLATGNNNNNNNNHNNRSYRRLERRQHFKADDAATATPSPVAEARQASSTFMANHQQPPPQEQQQPATETPSNAKSSSPPQKTPRMIQRLVAGHIQNAEGRSTYQISEVTTNSSTSKIYSAPETSTTTTTTTTVKPTPLYFRRRPAAVQSSSYRHVRPLAATTTSTTTEQSPPSNHKVVAEEGDENDDHDDDAALLDEPGDFDNWDNGILRLSAGAGKEGTKAKKGAKDDAKKTLADQVRDGKYGLIEKELFRREPKRPGVLSYLPNKEVPIDNERNFGGLQEDDIWLAEDHLLVIKGGSLNEGERNDEPWAPIDDYDAPGRQIKIPKQPKVPPPFPVQLDEGGPLQFIGNNKFTLVYPSANESLSIYTGGSSPTGSTGDGYAPSARDGDDAKNSIARPGASPVVAPPPSGGGNGDGGGEGVYGYPATYPPWLYHNQTFVNPFLKDSAPRPITFAGIGPFPIGLGRNGSLEGFNGTTLDDFDEDDPSLYYPPAYSFVYKSNYSNPVPPGPLVPGIVLPPPPDHFTRLEKPSKAVSSTTLSPTATRQRVTSTSTTSTSSTTTTTTTATPFRHAITKISEYTPKTIIITPEPPTTPRPRPTPAYSRLPPTPSPSPTPSTALPPTAYEVVPVPVAIPVPIYPDSRYPTARPNVVAFVPTTPEPEPFSKVNPIYYEYFEAKRQPSVSTANTNGDYHRSTTTQTPTAHSPKPIKLYAAQYKRPIQQKPRTSYLQPVAPTTRPTVTTFTPPPQENIVYITPKPEIRYQPAVSPPRTGTPVYQPPRPLDNFEREVNSLRETLRYYQNQQLRDNSIPRTPKAKPVYDYSFDAARNIEPAAGDARSPSGTSTSFRPPTEYDEEPFKPMVTYSPPVDDANSFRAIAYDKADAGDVPPPRKYQSTTTLVPVQADNQQQYQLADARQKKQRLGAKYLQQSLYQQQQQQQLLGYQASTPRTILTTQTPWAPIGNKQPLQQFDGAEQYLPLKSVQRQHYQQQSERLQVAPPQPRGAFTGYYYRRPQPVMMRQNNRFYDEPFQQPLRKIINYRPPQQQQQQQPYWNLENDTYVNYAPNRPPLNPDAEFIQPYPYPPQRYTPPALSHQSQYYLPPQRLPPPPPPPPPQRQHQTQVPLHRDILVNYRAPLPPLNPDSEYINHPQAVRNQAHQIYRSNPPLPPPPYRQQPASLYAPNGNNGGGVVPERDSNVFYLTPKYRRANVNANNNSNNNGEPRSENDNGADGK